jgi:RNA polymerase sigma-70 factor (ECF subfamily)
VAQEGTEPKIHQYLPIKDLRNWVAIVAVRRAIDLSKKTKKEFALLEKDLSRAPEFKSDPELEYLKSLYQHEFAVAFKQALGLLTCQERNLLRYHVLDGLNIDQLGIIYKAHRATVARWLAKIRQKLLNKTRRIIMQTLKASPTEYESIMHLIQSQLHASIEEHLNREPEK